MSNSEGNYIINGILIVIFIVILYCIFCYFLGDCFSNTKEVKSSIDGKKYKVQEDLACPSCAADQMAKINSNIKLLIRTLMIKYPQDPRVQRLKDRYNPENVLEGAPGNGKDTSFSIAKGRKIVFCLRSAKNPDVIHDINILMFVAIHELAHLASVSYGHNREFVNNFKFLLIESENLGIYKNENYYRKPVEFCGMVINSNPVTSMNVLKPANKKL